MYDLIKQKSTGSRIIFGIIIFAFISAVLKMAFYKPNTTLSQDMVKAANEINSHAPIIVDSTTRLDNVNALPGHVFQYNYSLVTLEQSQIDTVLLQTIGRQSMIEYMKHEPKAAFFRDNDIIVKAKYVDKNGSYIGTISVNPGEY
jgi:hypothetical protein